MSLTSIIVQIIAGAVLLAVGADRFITASVVLARNFNLPTLLVGMLFVGFGTSFPELVVSAIAAWHHKAAVAVGNVIGSNIANVGLVLGLAVLIMPLSVHTHLAKRELPILTAIALVVAMLLWHGDLSRFDGIILLLLLAIYISWVAFSMRTMAHKLADKVMPERAKQPSHDRMSLLSRTTSSMPLKHLPITQSRCFVGKFFARLMKITTTPLAILWWLVGLGLLFIGSECLVNGAVGAARWMGISDLVVGLTVVTIGTSLPELAATISSALKKQHDIALGHIVGSNAFNLLAVLAMPALIAPGTLSPGVLYRDYPIMLGYILLLWLVTFCLRHIGQLGRIVGGFFLLGYVIYLGCLLA